MISIPGRIVDPLNRRTFPGVVVVDGERIAEVRRDAAADGSRTVLPGFVDAHVHVESSMLVPSEFARLAVAHGTVATVSDPHEIANVCGVEGVRYMLENGERVPFTFAFGAPSCVPATPFETAGAAVTAADLRELFRDPRVRYLSEMMNWPGVLADDPVVLEKLRVARESGRVVDGHAPGLRGDDARAYAAHGITTDHECFTLEEALDKIAAGMKILIREGSAARNFDALHPLLSSHPQACMLCSDDLHPDALVQGHLDRLVRRALEAGHDAYDVLRAACVHPVRHYGLPVGLLQPGDHADLIVVDGLERLTVLQTYVRGRLVAERGATRIAHVAAAPINNFTVGGVAESSLRVSARGPRLRVIEALDGQLVTRERIVPRRGAAGPLAADPERDVLKLAVVNRYREAAPALAFIAGFGLKRGALASSVAHDSHNVVAVGASDADLARATNAVLAQRGGIAVACDGAAEVLPLPIAGLMSADDGYQVARRYAALDARAKELGSRLRAPFMTLSFMALLVIPALKLSDRGLFDGQRFAFTPLSVE